jgi:hypothetical protein
MKMFPPRQSFDKCNTSGIYDIKGFIQHKHTLMLSLIVVYVLIMQKKINGVDIKSKLFVLCFNEQEIYIYGWPCILKHCTSR